MCETISIDELKRTDLDDRHIYTKGMLLRCQCSNSNNEEVSEWDEASSIPKEYSQPHSVQ